MRGPEGGFYSAFDADSEGEEGLFYVWSSGELVAALEAAGLHEETPAILSYWGVSEEGNFEGRNILHVPGGPDAPVPPRLAEARAALYDLRSDRVWPGLDDKRILSWNALMIAALAEAGAVFGRSDYLDAASRCAEFIWTRMRTGDGRLLRTWKEGEARLNAYLEDHAYLVDALTVLYESTFDPRWFVAAREAADAMVARFADSERGGFFTTSHDHEELVARRKDADDHPIPSGNSAAAYALLRLAALTGDHSYERRATSVFDLLARVAARHPQAVAHLLRALDFHLASVREVALISADGSGLDELAAVVRSKLRPHLVLAGGVTGSSEPELLADRTPLDGHAAAYVCERFACGLPVSTPEALSAVLDESAG